MHGPEGEGGFGSIASYALQLLSSYGWIICVFVATYFIFGERIVRWWQERASGNKGGIASYESVGTESDQQRTSLVEARRKMQEQLDAAARAHAEKVAKEREEQLRVREAQLRGATSGQRLGDGRPISSISTTLPAVPRKKPLGRIRDDNYLPLGGGGAGGTGGFRSSRGACGPRGG